MSDSTAVAPSSDWRRLFSPVPVALTAVFLAGVASKFLRPKNIASLPAHPLILHIPVVLVPLFAAVAVAYAIRPQWIPTTGLAASIAGLAIMIITMLTVGSGKSLEHEQGVALIAKYGTRDKIPAKDLLHHRLSESHGELGERTRWIVAALVLMVVGQYIVARVQPKSMPLALLDHKVTQIAFRAVTVVFAVLAVIWMFRTGHSGAELVYKQRP